VGPGAPDTEIVLVSSDINLILSPADSTNVCVATREPDLLPDNSTVYNVLISNNVLRSEPVLSICPVLRNSAALRLIVDNEPVMVSPDRFT
jgi:hypothetical protein